ncbi:MAG: protein TolR [Kiloniellales bacterium]
MARVINIDGGQVQANGRQRYPRLSQINVTPFVDVMLVLLVIFMITAPLLTVGVPVDLPQTQAPPLTQPDEPLEVTVNAKGEVFLQETRVELDALVPRLVAITRNNPEARIYVRGDRAINYGRVLEVMGLITGAGFTRLALVSAPAGRR